MKPFEKFDKVTGRRKKQNKFKQNLGGLSESPIEEELDREEQERVKEEGQKPKVPKRINLEGLGFRAVKSKVSKEPNLPTIPENTPARPGNKGKGSGRGK